MAIYLEDNPQETESEVILLDEIPGNQDYSSAL